MCVRVLRFVLLLKKTGLSVAAIAYKCREFEKVKMYCLPCVEWSVDEQPSVNACDTIDGKFPMGKTKVGKKSSHDPAKKKNLDAKGLSFFFFGAILARFDTCTKADCCKDFFRVADIWFGRKFVVEKVEASALMDEQHFFLYPFEPNEAILMYDAGWKEAVVSGGLCDAYTRALLPKASKGRIYFHVQSIYSRGRGTVSLIGK